MGADYSTLNALPPVAVQQPQQLVHFAPPQNLNFATQIDIEPIASKVQKHISLISSLGQLVRCSKCGEKRDMLIFPCNHALCGVCAQLSRETLKTNFVLCSVCKQSFVPYPTTPIRVSKIHPFWSGVAKNETIMTPENVITLPLRSEMGKYPIQGCRGDLPVEALCIALGRIGFFSHTAFFALSQTCRMLYIAAQQENVLEVACGDETETNYNEMVRHLIRKDISGNSGPFNEDEQQVLNLVSSCSVDSPTTTKKRYMNWYRTFLMRLLMVPNSPSLFLTSPYVIYKYGVWEMSIVETQRTGKALVCMKDTQTGLLFPSEKGNAVYFEKDVFVRISNEMNFKAKVASEEYAITNPKCHTNFVSEYKRMPKLRYDLFPSFGFVNLSFAPFRFIIVDEKQRTEKFSIIFENDATEQTTFTSFALHDDGQIYVDSMFIDFGSICKLAAEKKAKDIIIPEQCVEHVIVEMSARICPCCLTCGAHCAPSDDAIPASKCKCNQKTMHCKICHICKECVDYGEQIEIVDAMGLASRYVVARTLRYSGGNADRAVNKLLESL